MLKTPLSQVKQYKSESFITPGLTVLEPVLELIVPMLMASMIDKGISADDMNTV